MPEEKRSWIWLRATLVSAVLAVALAYQSAASAPIGGEIDAILERAEALADSGSLNEADSLAAAALTLAEARYGANSPVVARALGQLVVVRIEAGRSTEPETKALAERELQLNEARFGQSHPRVALSLGHLAAVHFNRGSYPEARKTLERALAIARKAKDESIVDIVQYRNDLATVLQVQGDFAGARKLLEKSLAEKERRLGPNHLDVAFCSYHLATLLAAMGEFAPAESLLERALSIRERALGERNADVANTLHNLAYVKDQRGDFEGAVRLYARTVAIREVVLGPNHPDLAFTLGNLASVYLQKGKFELARPLLERALTIKESVLGSTHPDVAKTLNLVAYMQAETGDLVGARRTYERMLTIEEAAYGADNPSVGVTLGGLAAVLQRLGEYKEAKLTAIRSLNIKERSLGPTHPQVAASLMTIAATLSTLGDYVGARPYYERALAIREKALGQDHPQVAESCNGLALLLQRSGDFAASRALYERAIAIYQRTLGEEHGSYATGLVNLGSLLRSVGDIKRAKMLCYRALAIHEKALGPNHTDVAADLNNLASFEQDAGNDATARELFERSLAVNVSARGRNHFEVATVLNNLGLLNMKNGNPVEAKKQFEEALSINEATLGSTHPRVATTMSNLGELHHTLGEHASALTLQVRSLSIQDSVLGSNHPDVAKTLSLIAREAWEVGNLKQSVDTAERAEEISRTYLRIVARAASEREALRYSVVRTSGLGILLSAVSTFPESTSASAVWDMALRSRALVLDEIAARHRSRRDLGDPGMEAADSALGASRERLANLVIRGIGRQSPAEYKRQRDVAQEEVETAERALALTSASFSRDLERGRVGLREVAASLPAKSALVGFFRYGQVAQPSSIGGAGPTPSYLAFVLRSGELVPSAIPLGSAAATDSLISEWRAAVIDRSTKGTEQASRRLGEALRRRIWDPLVSKIGSTRRVLLVPDGSINLVDFAALPIGGREYLIEAGHVIQYISAERDLVSIGMASPVGEGLLALGGADFERVAPFPPPGTVMADAVAQVTTVASSYRGPAPDCVGLGGNRFEFLPGSALEVSQVASTWGKASADGMAIELRGANASETAFKSLARGRRVLHLATHGYFIDDRCVENDSLLSEAVPDSVLPVHIENPLLRSGLVLAGANRRQDADPGEDDGILTAAEAASMDLTAAEWVVLSGCNTGRGSLAEGEGVLGLRRAVQIAGAKSLIMSLWNVDDQTTQAWMRRLYEARWRKGLGAAESVRAASLQTLKQRRNRGLSTAPAAWAGFIATEGLR